MRKGRKEKSTEGEGKVRKGEIKDKHGYEEERGEERERKVRKEGGKELREREK